MRGSRRVAGPLVQEQSNRPVVNASVDSKDLDNFGPSGGCAISALCKKPATTIIGKNSGNDEIRSSVKMRTLDTAKACRSGLASAILPTASEIYAVPRIMRYVEMKYCVRPSGEALSREATIKEIEQGLRSGTMGPDWKVWPLGDRDDDWDTLAELCAFLPPLPRRWYRVRVRATAISFPRVCPHCLQPADQTLSVESSRNIAGYYVFYSKFKYFAIQVPFCAAAVRRAERARIIWLIGFFGCLATSLTVASLFTISNESFMLLAFLLLIPAWLPGWINRTEKFIRIEPPQNGSTAFLLRDLDYARLLDKANNSG